MSFLVESDPELCAVAPPVQDPKTNSRETQTKLSILPDSDRFFAPTVPTGLSNRRRTRTAESRKPTNNIKTPNVLSHFSTKTNKGSFQNKRAVRFFIWNRKKCRINDQVVRFSKV